MATTYTWNQTAANTYAWTTTANWIVTSGPGSTFPGANAGDTALFTNNIAGNTIVNITSSFTIAQLSVGDNSGSSTFTIQDGAGTNTLTITPAAGFGITKTGSGADVISCPIALGAACTVSVASSQTLVMSGIISGAFSLTKTTAGTLKLSGANTYSNGTTITTGTLQIGNAGSTGSAGSGGIVNNAVLVYNRTDAALIESNAISGTGTLTNSGTGTITLTGTNTYSGITTVSTGTLKIGNNGTVGTLGTNTITVTSPGILNIFRSDAITLGSIISGTGALTQSGTGTTSLTVTHTYSGITTITDGVLSVGSGGSVGTLGTSTITVTSPGNLTINKSTAVSLGQIISGTGSLTQSGSGTTSMTVTHTYIGATTVTNGILSVGSAGTVGAMSASSAITVTSPGVFQVSRTNAITITNSITGTGSFTKASSGTTTFTGNNKDYSGGNTVTGGTLLVGVNAGASAQFGTGPIALSASTVLSLNGTTAYTITGAITGAGGITVAVTGVDVTITSNGNTYSGTTTITSGNLIVGDGTTGSFNGGAVTIASTFYIKFAIPSGTTALVNGVISGSNGGFETLSTHAGTVVMVANNTFDGLLTSGGVNGTIRVGNGGTTGSTLGSGTFYTGDVGTLEIWRSDNVELQNDLGIFVLSPSAINFRKLGSNTLQCRQTLAHSGYTYIDGGILSLGIGSNVGNETATISNSIGIIIASGALLQMNNDNIIIYIDVDPPISGAGGFINIGPGGCRLTNANTYTGPTSCTIINKIFGIGSGRTSIVPSIASSSSFTLAAGTEVRINIGIPSVTNNITAICPTFSGSSAVSLWFHGNSSTQILAITSTMTYTGTTTIDGAGRLQLGNNTANGSIVSSSGVVTNTSTVAALAINRTDDFNLSTICPIISGTGLLRQDGTGTVYIDATHTYTGSTFASAGVLSLGTGGTIGAIDPTGTVGGTLTGTFWINRSTNPFTLANLLSLANTSQIIKKGTNTVIITNSGSNSGTSSTLLTIEDGTLQIGVAGGASAGYNVPTYLAVSTSIIDFRGNTSYTCNKPFSGIGRVNISNGAANYVRFALTAGLSPHSYSGTTTISGGNLMLGNLGTTTGSVGTGTITIASGNVLTFNLTASVTQPVVTAIITGAGGVSTETTNLCTATLSGVCTYTGPTTINAGTLQIGNGGTTGSIASTSGVAVSSGAFLSFNRSDALTHTPVISGAGAVTQVGSGTTSLNSTETYTGATTITAGALSIGAGSTTGTLLTTSGIAVSSGAFLQVNRSDPVTLSSVGAAITGAGGLRQAGTGTTSISATQAYTGPTDITAGTLSIGTGSTAGAINTSSGVTVAVSTILQINRSDSLTLSTICPLITGAGGLTKLTSNTLSLDVDHTFTGPTTVSAGILSLGTGSTAGNVASTSIIITGTALQVNRSNALTIVAAISGTSGILSQIGAGTTSLSGASTYTGATTITTGTLSIGANSTTGSILGTTSISVSSGAILQINRSDSIIFDTITSLTSIGGTGNVLKVNTNNCYLLTNLTIAGSMTISAGTFVAGGGGTTGALSVAGVMTVSSGAGMYLFRSDDVNLSDICPSTLTGTGIMWQQGPGTVSVNSPLSFATGDIYIDTSTMSIGSGGAAGTITCANVHVQNGGVLRLNRSDAIIALSTILSTGSVSGNGALNKINSNTINIDNSVLTYTGQTTLSAGTLSIGTGGTTGTIANTSEIAISSGAILQFNRSDALTQSAIISGTGGILTQAGTGVTTLTGANTYTGQTNINAGTLEVSTVTTGNTLGCTTFGVDNALLTFNTLGPSPSYRPSFSTYVLGTTNPQTFVYTTSDQIIRS